VRHTTKPCLNHLRINKTILRFVNLNRKHKI
jgi:hypothetical protein